MGFTTADRPAMDPGEIIKLPWRQRLELLTTHWAEYGFGGPKQMHMLYIIKLVLYIFLSASLASLTSGLGWFWNGNFWNEPIFYQKLVAFTVLWEVLGIGHSSGPLAFRFSPMMGGALYYGRVGTLRSAPWPHKLSFTAGHFRTPWDVVVYYALLLNLVLLVALPGTHSASLARVIPESSGNLMNPLFIYTYLGLLLIMGLRDKIVFLATRPEQYAWALLFFAIWHDTSIVNMIVACKILMAIIWIGAGISKINHHFLQVVPPMMSNTPWLSSPKIKRLFYRDYPSDLRPSKVSWFFAHVLGTAVELVGPILLLTLTNSTLLWMVVIGMFVFHLFITSTFPLAVPLEWNILFMFVVVFLFGRFQNGDGWAIWDMNPGWLPVLIIALLLIGPIWGNLRPDQVSFLISMRKYAGNWACSLWAFTPGAEDKINQHVKTAGKMQADQLAALYPREVAEMFMDKIIAFRVMHSQGRMEYSLLQEHLGDKLDDWSVREGETVCAILTGWQFGEGHAHNKYLMEGVQELCQWKPGEVLITWTESQPIHKDYLRYMLIDPAVGVIERGRFNVAQTVAEQPWLPNGPIPHQVDWSITSGTPDPLAGAGSRA